MEKDLTQHFLYTYEHADKIGPGNTLRYIFKDDLIFDKSRKSIYTQGQEFGYISDYSQTVYTYNSAITISSYEGQLSVYQHDHIVANSLLCGFEESLSVSNSESLTVELGKSLKLTSAVVTTSATNSGSCYLYLNNELISSTYTDYLSSDYGLVTFTNLSKTITSNGSKNVLTAYIVDPETSYGSYISCDILYKNHIHIYEIPDSYSTIINGGLSNNYSSYIKKNILSNDYGAETNINHYQCTNGKNTTVVLSFPYRLYNNDILYGDVCGLKEEFVRAKTFSYINGSAYSENYCYYVAHGNNWNGQELKIGCYNINNINYIDNITVQKNSGSSDNYLIINT
jgi:hypothetical protein